MQFWILINIHFLFNVDQSLFPKPQVLVIYFHMKKKTKTFRMFIFIICKSICFKIDIFENAPKCKFIIRFLGRTKHVKIKIYPLFKDQHYKNICLLLKRTEFWNCKFYKVSVFSGIKTGFSAFNTIKVEKL